MRTTRRLAYPLAFVVGLAMPAPAAAQFDLSGFVGPVTISHYARCQFFFCAEADVGVGKNRSGRFFAELLRLDHSFDAERWNSNGTSTYPSHYVNSVEMRYADPVPTDPLATEWWFLFAGSEEHFITPDYGSQPTPGTLLVEYAYTVALHDPPGGFEGGDLILFLDPVRVTTTPEPATLTLVATGIAGLLAAAWRRRASGRCRSEARP